MDNKKLAEVISYASVLQEARSYSPKYNDYVALVERLKVRIVLSKFSKSHEEREENEFKINLLKQLVSLYGVRKH